MLSAPAIMDAVIELERAAEALRDSQRFLGLSLDALADHVAILDESGVIVTVNEAWRRFADASQCVGSGYCIGTNYLDSCEKLFAGDTDGPIVAAGIRTVLAGTVQRFEREYPCHSPTEKHWFLMRAVRIAGPGPARVVVAHDNITDRRRAEQLLAGQRQVLEKIAGGGALEEVLSALIQLIEEHSDGVVCSILIRRRDGTHFSAAVGPSLPAHLLSAVANAPIAPPWIGPGGMAAHLDQAVITGDIGTDERFATSWRELWTGCGFCSCHSVPIRSSEGSVLGSFDVYHRTPSKSNPASSPLNGMATHLAAIAIEREWTETALREMSERQAEQAALLGRVLSSLRDYTYTFDLEGRITFANQVLLDFWGLTLPGAMGKSLRELNYPPDVALRLNDHIRQVIDTRQYVVGELSCPGPDGAPGHSEYIFTPVFAADGTVSAVAGSSRDITARKEAGEALKRLADDKARLLAGEHAARADAEAANRAKDRFLAVLSHELRTPLTPVMMTAAALEMNPDLPAEVRADMRMIRINVELETKLIDDLLDLSRIVTGKLALKFQEIDLNELVRHVCAMCRPALIENGIRLHCTLDGNAGRVAGDSARLHQVLWNLLNNAAKFTPRGGDIHLTSERLEGDRVRLRVRDTGIGIPAEVLPRIFDAFEQGEPGITRRFGGLGIGLAICKVMLDRHHGSIRAESAGPDRGSTFTVELPALALRAELRSLKPAPPAPALPAGTPPLRILLVDDHADTVRILKRLLTASGHTVKTAHNAAEALELSGLHPFDLIVSDLGLPDLTGHELMVQIRSLHGTRGIAMSGYGMEEDFRKSEACGFSEHLVKPVSLEQLERCIERVTGGGKKAGPLKSPARHSIKNPKPRLGE